MYQIDTSNVLFILSGAFVGLDAVIKRRVAKGVSQTLCRDTLIYSYPLQSIGFTAELGSNDDTPSSDFMPFFTPNRRPLPNMLEHVEPAGEMASLTYNIFLTLAIRSGQVWVHPGIHLAASFDSDARPAHANGPTTNSHRGSRVLNISVYSPV